MMKSRWKELRRMEIVFSLVPWEEERSQGLLIGWRCESVQENQDLCKCRTHWSLHNVTSGSYTIQIWSWFGYDVFLHVVRHVLLRSNTLPFPSSQKGRTWCAEQNRILPVGSARLRWGQIQIVKLTASLKWTHRVSQHVSELHMWWEQVSGLYIKAFTGCGSETKSDLNILIINLITYAVRGTRMMRTDRSDQKNQL